MRRMAFAMAALVGFCAAPARADTVPLFEGIPATYTPGQPFAFTLRLPEMIGLLSYQLELVFGTAVTNPPLLAFPSFVPPPDGTSYVFGSADLAGFAFLAPPGATDVRLTLTDPADPDEPQGPADVVAGANDFLATITVAPGADLTGPITIGIGNSVFLLLEGEPPGPPEPVVVAQSDPNAVPAPAGAVLLGLGALLLGARSRLLRRPTP